MNDVERRLTDPAFAEGPGARLRRLEEQAIQASDENMERRIAEHEESKRRAAAAGREAEPKPRRKRKSKSKSRTAGKRTRKATTMTSAKDTERKLLHNLEAASSDTVFEAAARFLWWKERGNESCPPDRIPGQIAVAILVSKMGSGAGPTFIPDILLDSPGWWISDPGTAGTTIAALVRTEPRYSMLFTLDQVLERWVAIPRQRRPPHPVLPLIAAWSPAPIVEGRSDLLMPRSVAHVDHSTEPCYLARFGQAVHRDHDTGQLLLGFATEGERGPTLPANIWTMGLNDAEKRGAVIPLSLRIWVGCILHTPLYARHGDRPVPLDGLTLRKFLRWLYAGKELPRPDEYWEPLKAARELLKDHEIQYERDGLLWSRQVVNLDMPVTYHRSLLNAPWAVTVWLPPGDGTGPPVDYHRLQRWARRRGGNAACWRALINFAYRWYIEGLRLAPVRDGKHWIPRRNPKLYDKLTDDDKDVIFFPPGTGKKRRDLRLADADAALELLIAEGDVTWIDGRPLPPPTRKATKVQDQPNGERVT